MSPHGQDVLDRGAQARVDRDALAMSQPADAARSYLQLDADGDDHQVGRMAPAVGGPHRRHAAVPFQRLTADPARRCDAASLGAARGASPPTSGPTAWSRGCVPASSTVTERPVARIALAASQPMNPPPTTTTSCAAPRASAHASAPLTSFTEITPAGSLPGRSAPGAGLPWRARVTTRRWSRHRQFERAALDGPRPRRHSAGPHRGPPTSRAPSGRCPDSPRPPTSTSFESGGRSYGRCDPRRAAPRRSPPGSNAAAAALPAMRGPHDDDRIGHAGLSRPR